MAKGFKTDELPLMRDSNGGGRKCTLPDPLVENPKSSRESCVLLRVSRRGSPGCFGEWRVVRQGSSVSDWGYNKEAVVGKGGSCLTFDAGRHPCASLGIRFSSEHGKSTCGARKVPKRIIAMKPSIHTRFSYLEPFSCLQRKV